MKIASLGALVVLAGSFAVPVFAQQASRPDVGRLCFKIRHVINYNDPTFNQELGINDFGVIAGYFGSGAAGHPSKDDAIFRHRAKLSRADLIDENFPGSVQTQVTGINNRDAFFLSAMITIGFWSASKNASMVNNNFGLVSIGGQIGAFIRVNNPNTGTINGVRTNQFLGYTVSRRVCILDHTEIFSMSSKSKLVIASIS